MKKQILLLTVLPLLLGACSSGNNPSSTSNGEKSSELSTNSTTSTTSTTSVVTKYTVTFANTSLPSVEIEEGKSLSKPTDPTKENCIFVGWYLDASFTAEVSFPLTINKNTTIYAKFYTYQEAFAQARKNTIGDSVAGYEYDYTLKMDVTYLSVKLSGNTEGNTKYNASSSDVSFYDEHTNSGALFYDGSKYQIKKARNLHEVSLDEDGIVKKYTIKEVGDDYKYDSSSFAKAVFEYDDTKLKEIKPTSVANEYELKTGFNASSGIALVGNYINHPIVEKIIGALPETSVNTGMYVTFTGDKLNSYRYEMNVNVSSIQFSLTYSLNFKNIGAAPTITPKVFNNTYVSEDEVTKAKTQVDMFLATYRSMIHSSYDFKVETAVGYEGKNDINATVKGFTKRKVVNSNVFYLNDYEVDSDHKNADLYKEHNLADCHGARVKLSTGEVHDLKKKLTSFNGTYEDIEVVSHDSSDDYYLFNILKMIDNISFIQKIVNQDKGTITYSIGSDNNGGASILEMFNSTLRLNALKECEVDVKAFGEFEKSSVSLKNFEFEIELLNGAFNKISLEMNGKYISCFPNSRDFTAKQDASFSLEVSIEATTDGSNYEPAEVVKNVK